MAYLASPKFAKMWREEYYTLLFAVMHRSMLPTARQHVIGLDIVAIGELQARLQSPEPDMNLMEYHWHETG